MTERAKMIEVIGRAMCGPSYADTPIPYRLLNDGTRVRVVDEHDYQDGTAPYWEWFHGHQATSALSALKAEGFAVVPVKPTEEMISALQSYAVCAGFIEEAYTAMLTASQGAARR